MNQLSGLFIITKLIGELEAALILPCQHGKQAKSFSNMSLSNP
jgi:hypothetical protein